MTEEPKHEKDVVVVNNDDDRSPRTGVWVAVIILVLILLFFLFGGMNLFSGGSTPSTPNTQAPTGNTGTGTSQ